MNSGSHERAANSAAIKVRPTPTRIHVPRRGRQRVFRLGGAGGAGSTGRRLARGGAGSPAAGRVGRAGVKGAADRGAVFVRNLL